MQASGARGAGGRRPGRAENSAYGVDEASVADHAVGYLWPNTTLMRYPGRGNFMVWRFVPVGPEETYEEFDFFFESATPTEAEMEAIRYIDEVLQPEDMANLVNWLAGDEAHYATGQLWVLDGGISAQVQQMRV